MLAVRQPDKYTDTEVIVSTLIRAENNARIDGTTLWYSFPKKYKAFVTDRDDGFAAALLLFSMSCAEDLTLTRPVSSHLMKGLEKVQRHFKDWFPDSLQIISIFAEEEKAELKSLNGGSVMSAFSGGADSFYTLLKHLPHSKKPTKELPIQYGFFAHGFDIPLNNNETYQVAFDHYQQTFTDLGAILIPVRTNIREISEICLSWEVMHGVALIAVPLILGNEIKLFYVPSSDTAIDEAWGSTPITDTHFSSEACEISHHKYGVTRFDKFKFLIDFPIIKKQLRTCWVKPNGLINCCECHGCISNMAVLESLKALDQFETYPLKLNFEEVRKRHFNTRTEYRFAKMIQQQAKASGTTVLFDAITYALEKSSYHQNYMK